MIIKTGYEELDCILKDFKKNNLYVIASRPKAGTTSFALNVLLNMGLMGIRTGYISLEESTESINNRLVSIVSGSRYSGPGENKNIFHYAKAVLKDFKYSLFESKNKTIDDIYNYLLLNRNYIDILFIDKLESFAYKEKSKIKGEAKEIVEKLKQLSTEFSIPVILLMNLSKRLELRKNKMPRPTDLHYADVILDNFTNILFLNRDSFYKDGYNLVDKESCEVIVTDPKIKDYRMIYLELTHGSERFYSRIMYPYYVDKMIEETDNYLLNCGINNNHESKNLSYYKEGILECIKNKELSDRERLDLVALYKCWIKISNYAICDIIYLVRDK